jgi:hypothetical protein
MISLVVAGILASTVLSDVNGTVLGLSVGPIDTILTGSAVLILAAGVLGYFTLPHASARPRTQDLSAEASAPSEISPDDTPTARSNASWPQ